MAWQIDDSEWLPDIGVPFAQRQKAFVPGQRNASRFSFAVKDSSTHNTNTSDDLAALSGKVQTVWPELPAEVEEVIRGVVRFKLRMAGAGVEDHCQEVRLQLLERLRSAPADQPADQNESLRGLAATIAWRVCAGYVRQRNPQFHALRNRIQYLLTRQSGFACWRESDRQVAGFSVWQGKLRRLSTGRLSSLRRIGNSFSQRLNWPNRKAAN